MRSACSLLLLLLLVPVSIVRNMLWQDETGIWRDTIAKSPRKYRAYNELALGMIAAGNDLQARELLARSLELNPYQGQAYINLGLALEHLGLPREAVRTYERALWLQPSDPTAYYNLGVLYYRTFGQRDRALEYFLQARDRDPRDPDVHEYLAIIYGEQGDWSAAKRERDLQEQTRR